MPQQVLEFHALDDVEWLKNNKCAPFIIDNFKVTYGFWISLGEPVYEYKFYWEYNKLFKFSHTHNGKKYSFTIADLEKYPDLIRRFNYVRPLPDIKFEVYLDFYLNNIEFPIATCKHLINIDLSSPSFVKDNYSVPGSKDWDQIFTNIHLWETPYSGGKQMEQKFWGDKIPYGGYVEAKDKIAYAKNMRMLLHSTSRIEVFGGSNDIHKYGESGHIQQSPKIISIEWDCSELKYIFDEYCSREEKGVKSKKTISANNKQSTTEKSGSGDPFWNSTTSSSAKIESSDEAFWNSTKVLPEQWIGKLDKAEVLYNQKKWLEAKELYLQVIKTNPELSYASSKIAKIDKLLSYKPKIEADYIAIRSGNSPNL